MYWCGKETTKTNWNLNSWDYKDDDLLENIRLQGKLRNLKNTLFNHFNLYQKLEKEDKKMQTNYKFLNVLPKNWWKLSNVDLMIRKKIERNC